LETIDNVLVNCSFGAFKTYNVCLLQNWDVIFLPYVLLQWRDRYNVPGVNHLKVTMTGCVVNQKEWWTNIRVITGVTNIRVITDVTNIRVITSVTDKTDITSTKDTWNLRDIAYIYINTLCCYNKEFILLYFCFRVQDTYIIMWLHFIIDILRHPDRDHIRVNIYTRQIREEPTIYNQADWSVY